MDERRPSAAARRRDAMRYMLLIYGPERDMSDMPQDPAAMEPWTAYTEWLRRRGWMEAGEPLDETKTATSVRVHDGERVVTDGPFAETKEALGGYYILDVANLDDAIEAAARCPGALYGTIELRPILDMAMPEVTDAG
jgi:hypothetical protein